MAQPRDFAAEARRLRAAAIAGLPGERLQVSGGEALVTWDRLHAEGRGWPLIVGGDEALAQLAEQATGFAGDPQPLRPVAEILSVAAGLHHPDDYIAFTRGEEARAREALARMPREQRMYDETVIERDGSTRSSRLDPLEGSDHQPAVGDWPTTAPGPHQLYALTELDLASASASASARPRESVTILRLPVSDGSEVPALLRWGGWNACPPPEYHVAALRSWRERYGAELVAMGFDTLELRVRRRPQGRDEALGLARELYAYCPDLVDQGYGTLAPLAANLMADDWWSFWWD